MKHSRFRIPMLLAVTFLVACGSDSSVHDDTSSADASASPILPLAHSGRWITDMQGRVVMLHGFNMVAKEPPYTPESVGFDDDDAEFLARNGFNAVRVGFMWKAAEPQPGAFDEAYLGSIERTVQALGRHGVLSLVDFHQDAYNEKVNGQGFPDWTVFDDGVPWIPGLPKEVQPAYQRTWDNFWANVEGPGAIGLWDRFAMFWQHVAKRFRGNRSVLGYDLMNEPWPGLQTPACLNPLVCPHDAKLAEFYGHVIPKIREVDPQTPIHYEGNLFSGAGMAVNIPVAEPNAVYSFHNYCATTVLAASFGPFPLPPELNALSCPQLEELTFGNAEGQADRTGHALLLTEFGSVPDLGSVGRVAAQADAHRIGWTHWTYFNTGTTNFPGTPSVVEDPSLPPSGANINHALLETLARPYPQVVAGTPQAWSFDPGRGKQFLLRYTTARADGQGRFPPGAETIVFMPEIQYPEGYQAEVSGGQIRSAPSARRLVIAALPGADEVSLTVTAGPQAPSVQTP